MQMDALNSDLDLRALRVFLVVLRRGGMTAAARELGLTQSAVSQIVARLEAAMDVGLIDRTQRPLVATAAGDALAARARLMLADVDDMVAGVRAAGSAARPRVRLGLIDSVAGTIGAPLIRAIRSEVREVSVWSGISPSLREDVARGRLDLVVTSDPLMAAGVRTSRLLREPFIAVLPKSFAHPPDSVEPLKMAALLPLVRYSVRSVIGAEIERELTRREQIPPRVFEFDGSDGVFAMVAAGLGWAITTPLCLVHGRMFGRDVRAVPLAGRAFTRDIFMLAANAVGAGLAKGVEGAALELIGDLVDNDFRRLVPASFRHVRVG